MEFNNSKTTFVEYKNILFWCIGLPWLGMVSIWSYFNQINPLDSMIFFIGFIFCLPKIFLEILESEKKASLQLANKFRKMTSFELMEVEVEISKMRPGILKSKMIEVYEIACRERFGVKL